MVDKKETNSRAAKENASSSTSAKSSNADNTTPVETAVVKAKTVKKKAAVRKNKAVATEASAPVVKVNKAATAATAKAAASESADLQSAARKISEVDKQTADSSIKSKASASDLKARAHEAKQRAQKKILEEAYVSDKPSDPLERLADTFDNSAKRWGMVVYPSLFAFLILASYGFFLIYRLTHDIAVLSQSVTHMAVIVSDAMPRMSKNLTKMTESIDNMTDNVEQMAGDIGGMSNEVGLMSTQMNSLTPLSENIKNMTHSMNNMNRSVYGMQRDMSGMNRTISSGPFGMMSDIMPFGGSDNVPPPIRQTTPIWPTHSWPSYYQAPWHNAPHRFSNMQERSAPSRTETGSGKQAGSADKSGVVLNGVKRQVIIPSAENTEPNE